MDDKEIIERLIRPNILRHKAYESARDNFKQKIEIYLDANENPFENKYNRYPDPKQIELKSIIQEQKKIPIENIFLGNGSDEGIDLIIRAFCEPRVDKIMVFEPSYGMYGVCANIQDVETIKIPLTMDFQIDFDYKILKDERIKLLFICNPNNPTGNVFNKNKIEKIINEFKGIVIIDEAYIDFSKAESYVNQVLTNPRLCVSQTFSKAYGMAGLRIGMLYAQKEIINVLNKIKLPYNLNKITQSLLINQLTNDSHTHNLIDILIEERESLIKELPKLNEVIKVYHSETNFLLVKFKDSEKMYKHLLSFDIAVRDRSKELYCEGCLRISVGTPKQNEKLKEIICNYK